MSTHVNWSSKERRCDTQISTVLNWSFKRRRCQDIVTGGRRRGIDVSDADMITKTFLQKIDKRVYVDENVAPDIEDRCGDSVDASQIRVQYAEKIGTLVGARQSNPQSTPKSAPEITNISLRVP
jgi:hypothetical protein